MISVLDEILTLDVIPGAKDCLQLLQIFRLIPELGLTPCFLESARICLDALSAIISFCPRFFSSTVDKWIIALSAKFFLSDFLLLEALLFRAII